MSQQVVDLVLERDLRKHADGAGALEPLLQRCQVQRRWRLFGNLRRGAFLFRRLRDSRMEKALFAADPLTGMITTVALVRPDKKLASVEVRSIIKRLPEKRFAAGVRREDIATCVEIGLQQEEFISLGLKAMQAASEELGL